VPFLFNTSYIWLCQQETQALSRLSCGHECHWRVWVLSVFLYNLQWKSTTNSNPNK